MGFYFYLILSRDILIQSVHLGYIVFKSSYLILGCNTPA
jgi:hypothetical protein